MGPWGKTWRTALVMALGLMLAVSPAVAGGPAALFQGPPLFLRPVSTGEPETPLEAQILSERPLDSGRSPYDQALRELLEGAAARDSEGGAVLRLPQNVKLRISFRYGGEAAASDADRQTGTQPLLLKSSLDYSLLPNLHVGLSGFLYHGVTDTRYFQRRYGEVSMGLGPGIRYDLGRWSLTLQSRYGTKGGDQKEGLQNWFRVWYAF